MNRPFQSPRGRAGLAPALLAAGTLLASASAMAELVLRDAWMGAVPPSAKVGAVYLVVENTGPEAASIGAATSPAAPRIELHQSVHGDGRVRMEERAAVTLAAGETLDFSVTGHHYMLYFEGLPVPAPGERVQLSITVNGSAAMAVSAEVRRPGAAGGHAHGHDHPDHAHPDQAHPDQAHPDQAHEAPESARPAPAHRGHDHTAHDGH